jgi:hypothetical protein
VETTISPEPPERLESARSPLVSHQENPQRAAVDRVRDEADDVSGRQDGERSPFDRLTQCLASVVSRSGLTGPASGTLA